MDVVEHEQQPRLAGQRLQQRPHRPVRPVALGLQAARLGPPVRRGGEHAAELDHLPPDEALEPLRTEPGGEVVQRVHPDAERELALELHAAAREHEMAARLRLGDERLQQPRLADPGLACDREPTRTGKSQPCERGIQRRLFRSTTDDPVANCLSEQCH